MGAGRNAYEDVASFIAYSFPEDCAINLAGASKVARHGLAVARKAAQDYRIASAKEPSTRFSDTGGAVLAN